MRQKQLESISDESEVLRQVTGAFWCSKDPAEEPMLVAVMLKFDQTKVAFLVEGDDSLTLLDAELFRSGDAASQLVDFTSASPWKEAIGLPLLWAWEMSNQQGYFDGFQLEFARDVASVSVIVQMLGVAGEVKIRSVPPDFVTMPIKGCSC